MIKLCQKCQIDKPIRAFRKDFLGAGDCYSSICKSCEASSHGNNKYLSDHERQVRAFLQSAEKKRKKSKRSKKQKVAA